MTGSTRSRWVLGIIVGSGLTLGLGWLSQLPFTPAPASAAAIRFSWRAEGRRVEQCRPPTDEELAGLPPHMRPNEICERPIIPYRLQIRLDGQTITDEVIEAVGVAADRPIHVFEEIAVNPGSHQLWVRFAPAVGGAGVGGDEIESNLALSAGEVALVTRSESSGFRVTRPKS